MPRPTARDLFEAVYPGLLARVQALGGEWVDEPWVYAEPTCAQDDAGTIITAQAAVRRVFGGYEGRTCVVNIAFRSHLRGGVWTPAAFSFNCGRNPKARDESFFRIDANRRDGPHCHLAGYEKQHLPWSKVTPRPSADPFVFVKLVEDFCRTGVIPLKVHA